MAESHDVIAQMQGALVHVQCLKTRTAKQTHDNLDKHTRGIREVQRAHGFDVGFSVKGRRLMAPDSGTKSQALSQTHGNVSVDVDALDTAENNIRIHERIDAI